MFRENREKNMKHFNYFRKTLTFAAKLRCCFDLTAVIACEFAEPDEPVTGS